jgi:hypothetical protein
MTSAHDLDAQPATLPELEHLLVRTARQRASRRRFGRRPGTLAVAFAATVLAAGAAAATGLVHLSEGTTSGGVTYTIDRQTIPAAQGPASADPDTSICLQLQYTGGGPAYGCGQRPTADRPFGLVIADSLSVSRDRVVYGLVADDVTRVSVLGDGDEHTDGDAVVKPGLPGRFFSITVPNRGRIELVGYDSAGQARAHIGSRARPDGPPQSKDEAQAQGDPAGFAPAVAPPSTFTYEGQSISPKDAAERGLVCAQDRAGVQCYDSLDALDKAQGDG